MRLHRPYIALSFQALLFFMLNTHAVFAEDGNSPAHLYDITKLQTHIDYLWILVAATLVLIMQAGFMCVESGLAKAKNSINVAIKNLADFILAASTFWIVGFGIMFGRSVDNYVGMTNFMIDLTDPWRVVFFLFQAMFVGTAATIVSGAVAGRTRFSSYLIISLLVSTIIYPVFGHWAWGGLLRREGAAGWLEQMGFLDFAGSTVVHSVGAWVALAACITIGPRQDKFNADKSVNEIPPHNMTLAYLGTFILFFGWFGFNCGSTMKVTTDIGKIALNTLLSACFGCIGSSVLSWINSPIKRPKGEMIANGVLGGLVGITAGCAYVETSGAALIGLISGCIVYSGVLFVERVLKIDDVVGAITVHGFCGVWGTLAVGIFITPEHLGDISRGHQFLVQGAGVLACFAWTFGIAFLLLKLVDSFFGGLRVSQEDEEVGLNISEHGARSTLNDLSDAMRRATRDRDFSESVKVSVERGNENEDLCIGFNRMVDAVQNALHQIRLQVRTAETAQRGAEVAERNLSENREEYDRRIQDIVTRLGGMMKEFEDTMTSIGAAAAKVQECAGILSGKSEEIDEVLATVEKIAFSTHLLTTNAKIQAAHAGEAGTGFSVVALQMGEVAQDTGEATATISAFTEEIKSMIQNVVESVEEQLKELHSGKERIDSAAGLIRELVPQNVTL